MGEMVGGRVEGSRGRPQVRYAGIGKCLVDGRARKKLEYFVLMAASRNRVREGERRP